MKKIIYEIEVEEITTEAQANSQLLIEAMRIEKATIETADDMIEHALTLLRGAYYMKISELLKD